MWVGAISDFIRTTGTAPRAQRRKQAWHSAQPWSHWGLWIQAPPLAQIQFTMNTYRNQLWHPKTSPGRSSLDKSNQIRGKHRVAVTQPAFTHHLFPAACKHGWKQSCATSKADKRTISSLLAFLVHILYLGWLCPSQLFQMDWLIKHSSEQGQWWSPVKEFMSHHRGCVAVPSQSRKCSHCGDTGSQLNCNM